MATLHAGALLARRYRLIDQVGRGGMSVIWRARDEVLERIVALKVLSTELAADARFRDLVREEARAAAQLVHPHVTAVHDYGESVAPDGTITAFVVMELLVGEELEARLTAGPLPWPEAVEVCAQVAEAVAAAHRLGIVHRDITPSNIMLTSVGAKVLDFGIATHVGAPDNDEDGETFGTPAYVAPERLDGTPAQPATDNYALGVLLFETLTGHPPYPAHTWADLARARRADPPPRPDVPGLPAAVSDVCRRCLARDPVARPSAHRVAEVLRASVPPPPAPVVGRQTAPLPPQAPAPTPAPEKTAVRGGARTPVFAALTAVGLAVGAVAVLLALYLARPATAPDGGALPPSAGSSTPHAAQPATSATGPSVQPPPTSAGVPTVAQAVSDVRQLILAGERAGAIRDDVALDLRQLVDHLRAADTADLATRVTGLREKVTVRAGEGAITWEYAEALDAALRRLATAQP
jgi:serine/threonine-protein kinase